MTIFRGGDSPFRPGDSKSFVGLAETKLLASTDDGATLPVHVYQVQFPEGARTNWHIHSGPQWLIVTAGNVRVQVAGHPSQDVSSGDAVRIEAGERHWHGAAPGHDAEHFAVNVNVTTEWLEPVSDEDYRKGLS